MEPAVLPCLLSGEDRSYIFVQVLLQVNERIRQQVIVVVNVSFPWCRAAGISPSSTLTNVARYTGDYVDLDWVVSTITSNVHTLEALIYPFLLRAVRHQHMNLKHHS